jgi:hypothetical protein
MRWGEKDGDEMGCGYMYTMEECMIKRWLSGIAKVVVMHQSV